MLVRIGSLLVSLALIVLTLSVFAALRDFGPEATVRRFHQAALANNTAELEQLSTHASNSDSVRMVASVVSAYMAQRAQIRVRRVDRSQQGQVVAEFVYIMPGRVDSLYWIVQRAPSGWVVNTDEMVGRQLAPSVRFNSRP